MMVVAVVLGFGMGTDVVTAVLGGRGDRDGRNKDGGLHI